VSKAKTNLDSAIKAAESEIDRSRVIAIEEERYEFDQARLVARSKRELQQRQLQEMMELSCQAHLNTVSRSLQPTASQLTRSAVSDSKAFTSPSAVTLQVTESDIVKKHNSFTKIFNKYFSLTQRRILDSYLSYGMLAEGYIRYRNYCFHKLKPEGKSFAGVLDSYTILPHQSFLEYIWVLELLAKLCCELDAFVMNQYTMYLLLKNGIKRDRRFGNIVQYCDLSTVRQHARSNQ